MVWIPWMSKAETGEKVQSEDEELPDYVPLLDGLLFIEEQVETNGFEVIFCASCASWGGTCPFHAEIPRIC